MKFFIEFMIYGIIGVIVLGLLASIDKAFLDSSIVILSLLGLIFNNLSSGDNSRIKELMQKSAACFVIVLAKVLLALGVSWIVAYLIGNYHFHESNKTPSWLLFSGILSLVIGSIFIYIKDKFKNSEGLFFAIYYAFILTIYIIFFVFDTSTQNVLTNLKKVFF